MSLEAIILLCFRVDLVAMVEGNSGIERSDQTLTFVSGKPGFGAAAFAGLIVAMAIAAFATGDLGTVATPGNTAGTVVLIIFFAGIAFLGCHSPVDRRDRPWSSKTEDIPAIPGSMDEDCCRSFAR